MVFDDVFKILSNAAFLWLCIFFRSARSSGVESLVLNVPQKYGCNSNGALALMLSIVQHFKFQNYWAKDIIFLVSEHDSCGVEAWLGSYHGEKSEGKPA